MQTIRVWPWAAESTHLDAAHVFDGNLDVIAIVPEPERRVNRHCSPIDWTEGEEYTFRRRVRAAIRTHLPDAALVSWDPGRDQVEDEEL